MRKVTIAFIVLNIAAITVFDVIALMTGYENTISAVLGAVGHKWPVVPFLCGLLCGHLWFPNRAVEKRIDETT